MTPVTVRFILAAALLLAAARPPAAQQVNAEARALEGFRQRVDAFVALRTKAEAAAPPLQDGSSPDEIDAHQRALAERVRQARSTAARGDLFTPEVEALVRRIMAAVFEGTTGAQIKASILDEHPEGVTVSVNGRYPAEVPLTTMPPMLLEELPKLPKELEYRFVGFDFVILDTRTHLVVDVLPDALPERP